MCESGLITGWEGFFVVVHCLPGTYQHDEIYLYGVIVPFHTTFQSSLFPHGTNIVEIRASGRIMDEFWPELPSYQYVAAFKTRERINNYRILEYLDRVAPPPPPPPVLVKKSKIIPSRKYKELKDSYTPGVTLEKINRRIEHQEKQMTKNEGLGEEYRLSISELDLDETEHLEWLLHEQER